MENDLLVKDGANLFPNPLKRVVNRLRGLPEFGRNFLIIQAAHVFREDGMFGFAE